MSKKAALPAAGLALLAGLCLPSLATMPAGDPPRPGPDPVEIFPRAQARGRAEPVDAGEVHVLALLQALADVSGKGVVYQGSRELRQERVRLAEPIESPTQANLTKALGGAGLIISLETYRGREVLWVTRQLRPSGRKGTLRPIEDDPPSKSDERPPARSLSSDEGVRLFQGGEGRAVSYLVIYESDSRVDAEEAHQVLLSLRETQRARRK